MTETKHLKTRKILAAAAGILLFALSLLPALLAGPDGYVTVLDQLDGEVPAYVLTAKHLQDDSIPEFMSGTQNKESLTPASMGTLLFYLVFDPAGAFLLNETFVRIIAFLGMYLLLRKWKAPAWTAYIAAFLFSLIEFYSVYGLAVAGQPLLLYGWMQAKDRKGGVLPYAIALLFAGFSSPVLVGYADALILLAVLVRQLIKKKDGALQTGLFLGVLVLTYGVLYWNLLVQVLGGADFVSHRTEWVLTQEGTWGEQFTEAFRTGAIHAQANQEFMIPWVLAAGALGAILNEQWAGREKQTFRVIWKLIAGAAAAAVIYATWRCELLLSLRRQIGGFLVSFRLERFFWLIPGLWWAAYGMTAKAMRETAGLMEIGGTRRGLLSRTVSAALAAVFLVTGVITVYDASPLKQNLIRLTEGLQEGDRSFRSFYSEELFREIDEYIGQPKDSYKVASIGLYPAVPLYNGFYCIDGYSNNYDIAYKHAFREIIGSELDKNEEIRSYFDDWGNRCYLFTASTGKRYYYTKTDTKTLKSLSIDPKALLRLGCRYIFSGIEIKKPKTTGLKLLKQFTREDSPYSIWVYQVRDSGSARTDGEAAE